MLEQRKALVNASQQLPRTIKLEVLRCNINEGRDAANK